MNHHNCLIETLNSPIQLMQLPGLRGLKVTRSAALIRLDEDGKVVEVVLDSQNRISNVAEVCECNGYLYTGSYYLPFIGRIKV